MYENDSREVTIEEIEKILIKKFGKISNKGCYTENGNWLSLESVLNAISEEI